MDLIQASLQFDQRRQSGLERSEGECENAEHSGSPLEGKKAKALHREAARRSSLWKMREARTRLHEGSFRRGDFVWVAGPVVSCVVEASYDPRKVDHVWIDLHAGDQDVIRIALNTCSLKNRYAGFDSRVRLGGIISPWQELPAAGIRKCQSLDYAKIEAESSVVYVEQEQRALEELLLEKAHRAVAIEGWGEYYVRENAGIHQLHSRRGSFGMPTDFVGRDGAVQFYFDEPRTRELLLFKFAGQP